MLTSQQVELISVYTEIELKRKNWFPVIFTVGAFLAPQIYVWIWRVVI